MRERERKKEEGRKEGKKRRGDGEHQTDGWESSSSTNSLSHAHTPDTSNLHHHHHHRHCQNAFWDSVLWWWWWLLLFSSSADQLIGFDAHLNVWSHARRSILHHRLSPSCFCLSSLLFPLNLSFTHCQGISPRCHPFSQSIFLLIPPLSLLLHLHLSHSVQESFLRRGNADRTKLFEVHRCCGSSCTEHGSNTQAQPMTFLPLSSMSSSHFVN